MKTLGILRIALLLICVALASVQAATVSVELSNVLKVGGEKVPLTSAGVIFRRGSGDPVVGALTVDFAISGSAGRGVDYDLELAIGGGPLGTNQITIPDGQASVSLFITPISDTAAEGQETVIVQVLAGTGYTPGLANSVQAPIADDDVDVVLTTPLPLAYEDYTTGPGSVLDPDSNRRGAFRVSLTPARGFSTYVRTEVSAAAALGSAQITTDYSVVYKIGGSGLGNGLGYTVQPRYILKDSSQVSVTGGSGGIPVGATVVFAGDPTNYTCTTGVNGPTGTLGISPILQINLENNVALTVTPVMPTAFKVNQVGGYPMGTTTIQVDGGSGNIPPGSRIAFSANPATTYTTVSGLAATSGALTISSALSTAVADNEDLIISWPNPVSGYVTTGANSEPVDGHTLRVTGGQGGFTVGDVFRIGTATSPQYRVTAWNGVDIVTFTAFTGAAGSTGGLPSVITGNPEIRTHFTTTPAGVSGREIEVLVPGPSTLIEYGIVPASDTTAEGVETLSMSLLTSNDYETVPPIAGQMSITDDDVVVSFNPSLSVNATEGGINGSFLVQLSSAFPRDRQIVYQVAGTATPGAGMTANDYVPLSGVLDIPAGSTSGIITVVPVDDGIPELTPETVVLTLQPTNDYRVVTTVGSTANASAEITINDTMGTVVIAPVGGSSTGREHPTAVTTAAFRIALVNLSGTEIPATDNLTVSYTIGGSATAGSDYQALSGSVVIPDGATFAIITITPLDDTTPEASEAVILSLAPAQGYTIGAANSATVTITDDEPVLAIATATAADATGSEAGDLAVFTLGYPPPALNRDIVVDLVYSGTAVAGDYALSTAHGSPTQVVIPANSHSTTVTVTPVQDTTPEGNETVIATITDKPTVYTRAVPAATVTIADDEPVLSITAIATTTTEGNNEPVFRVAYDGAPLGRSIVVTLSYPTTTATATASDFTTAPPTSVTIPADDNEVLVTISPKNDGVLEGTETVECVIAPNASLYAIATASTTCGIADLLPILTLEGDLAITEGGTFNVVLRASFAPAVPFTVSYVVSGDATAGATANGTADYRTLNGTVQVSGEETVIPVVTFTDAGFDPFELVIITLEEEDPPTFRRPGTTPVTTFVQILDALHGVEEVYADEGDGDYTAGDQFTIHVVFTRQIVVSGSPTLRLETGANDGVATFVGLSGDEYEAIFTYTVRGTDHSPNLDYVSSAALSLNGGSIVSLEGVTMAVTLPNPGSAGSLSFSTEREIDGGIPDGKPAPGAVGAGSSGGGCGLGSGFAALLMLCMLAGFAVSIRSSRG